jgi:hypothetical protein
MLFEFIRRIFAGTAPESNAEMLRGDQRTSIIENREPPMPGITQIASADVIAQIFESDAARQALESTRGSAHGGAISLNRPRK